MEMTQYQKDLVRMWDSLRDKHKDAPTCVDVNCNACPLDEYCSGNNGNITFNSEKAIEIVTQWAKEHLFVTYEQKYEETFGVKPRTVNGNLPCPRNVGFNCKCVKIGACGKCTNEFWGSEYKPPKTGKEGV